jgi:hypothetical protein
MIHLTSTTGSNLGGCDERGVYKILIGKSDGKKPPGKLRTDGG